VIQTEDKNIREARLRLVAAAKQTIANALRLLDIQAPEVM
jgi:arginyl-tRNA synthetase